MHRVREERAREKTHARWPSQSQGEVGETAVLTSWTQPHGGGGVLAERVLRTRTHGQSGRAIKSPSATAILEGVLSGGVIDPSMTGSMTDEERQNWIWCCMPNYKAHAAFYSIVYHP